MKIYLNELKIITLIKHDENGWYLNHLMYRIK